MRTRWFSGATALALVATGVWVAPVSASPDTGGSPAHQFLTGPNEGAPEDVALDYLRQEAGTLGLQAADVAELDIRSSYVSRHTGVTHVNVNQRYAGLEVFGADTTVNVAADGSVVHVGGASVSGLPAVGVRGVSAPDLDPVEAVEAAADALDLAEPVGLEQLPVARSADADALVSDGGISEQPIPATLGWQPVDDGLRLAWQLVIDDASDVHLWNATVDAETGELLEVEDWTSDGNVDDIAARIGRSGTATTATAASPASGPILTPNPVMDGSSYRVYPLPLESPNDGPRALVENPADADASPFGWHDVSGTPEPDFTITRGNNTNTYADWNNSNSPDNAVLTVTVDEPSSAAGSYGAVAASFGPAVPGAGITGDFALADDGSGIPTEGCAPLIDFPAGAIAVMDRGNCPFVEKVAFAQAAGAVGVVVANNVAGNPIAMGGSDPSISIPSVMVSLADGDAIKAGLPATGGMALQSMPSQPDGGPDLSFDFELDLTEHPHEYWEAAVTNLFYWCNVAHDVFWHYGFDEPSGNFQHNNYGRGGVGGDAVNCEAQDGGGMNNANFSTPAADGGTPRMQMYLWNAQEPFRDGDLEAGIVLHEYSHGISNRLTGGPGINCLGGDQRMGEGWSDYHGIVTLIDPALDDPDGPRGMGTYARWHDEPPRQGPGIRPAPYSRDMFIQPFTYASVGAGAWLNGGTLAAPHGVGHGWNAILWDMTWDLIDVHGFNPDVYGDWSTGGNNLSQQLVMDGLKFQGCNPNFVTGRDAILAAETVLTGGENYCTLWASFARRGLGYSASSVDNSRAAAVEGFDTHPDCMRPFLAPGGAVGELTTRTAGDVVPLRFDLGSNQGLDVFASNSPFSRQVDCDTLAVVSEGEHVTPRARPIATEAPGGSGLTVNNRGVYTYRWLTDADWAGTCRELVLTLDDGVQHRAFFSFVSD
ncbi:M36 family metallopeptidase [Egicoccus sp. AB-alg2]|uniref:M36 family metallopeptidase n=1 Tax=Egicoccus sp. AB-alg2 TaxID=3242693 RepID=UPI00359D187C